MKARIKIEPAPKTVFIGTVGEWAQRKAVLLGTANRNGTYFRRISNECLRNHCNDCPEQKCWCPCHEDHS